MGKILYLWTVVWREAGTISRVISSLVVSGPTGFAIMTGYFEWNLLLPWWGWALGAAAAMFLVVFLKLLESAYSLQKSLETQVSISDPDLYVLPWRGKTKEDKGTRHFFVTIENLGTGHIKNCSLKEVSFKNVEGHTAPEAGRIFRKKRDIKADQTSHVYEKQFDLRGKGDAEQIEICYMDETADDLHVVMTYATTPTHSFKDSIPRTLFPHELTVRLTADNLPIPVKKTFLIDVTPEGYLAMRTVE